MSPVCLAIMLWYYCNKNGPTIMWSSPNAGPRSLVSAHQRLFSLLFLQFGKINLLACLFGNLAGVLCRRARNKGRVEENCEFAPENQKVSTRCYTGMAPISHKICKLAPKLVWEARKPSAGHRVECYQFR